VELGAAGAQRRRLSHLRQCMMAQVRSSAAGVADRPIGRVGGLVLNRKISLIMPYLRRV
jgi:hypothetical protein